MARGWESKAAESNAEDARARREQKSTPRKSADEIEREAKRASLELSRRRIARELTETTSPLRKASLEAALAHLDGQLEALGDK